MRKAVEHPWNVPLAVSEVPETGRRIELFADASVRAAVAKLADLRDLPRLEAVFDVTLHGHGGLRVCGHVLARVGQTCVVTLDPVDHEIDEQIDLVFSPAAAQLTAGAKTEDDDAPEPLIGDVIDLGAIATEFLLLAIDPYPRKPGAVFEVPPADHATAHPFAALAALKKGQSGKSG